MITTSKLNFDTKQMKILIIDDHELMRKSIAKILQKFEFKEVIECFSSSEAIERFSAEVIDLVFCDLYMKGVNGYDVLKAIRNHDANCDVPIIVLTGEAGKDDIVKAADLGVNDYILKPFNPTDVEKKVTSVLTKYHTPTPLLDAVRKAERALLEKDHEKARFFAAEALKMDRHSARALHVLANSYVVKGEIQQAIELLKMNVDANPSFVKSYATLANIYYQSQKITDCVHYLTAELKLHPKQPARQILLAQLLVEQGQHAAAIEHYRLALLENNKQKSALHGMGIAYGESGNLEKALYYFKRARKHHPTSTKSLELIVKYCLQADKARFGENLLKDEKKVAPKRLDTYLVLGRLYTHQELYEEALAITNEALAIQSDYTDGLVFKSQILVKMGQVEEAINVMGKARQIAPNAQIEMSLAALLTTAERYEEAIAVLQACGSNSQNKQHSKEIMRRLGNLMVKTRQYRKANFIFLKLAQALPGNREIDVHIAQLKKAIQDERKLAEKQAS
jgi:two-component system chemotaxis response regulator CheY